MLIFFFREKTIPGNRTGAAFIPIVGLRFDGTHLAAIAFAMSRSIRRLLYWLVNRAAGSGPKIQDRDHASRQD